MSAMNTIQSGYFGLFQQITHGACDEKMANKALHLTAIPLRSIAAGELGRYVYHNCITNILTL